MPENEVDDRSVRRNARWFLIAIVGIVLLGLAGGLVAGIVHNGHGPRHPVRAAAVFGAVVLVAVGVLVASMVVLLRRPAYRQVMQYGMFERRRVWKAVKSGRELSPHEVQVATAARNYLRQYLRFIWFMPLLVVVWALDGLAHHGAFRWFMLGLAAVYALLVPYSVWEMRRAATRYDKALARY